MSGTENRHGRRRRLGLVGTVVEHVVIGLRKEPVKTRAACARYQELALGRTQVRHDDLDMLTAPPPPDFGGGDWDKVNRPAVAALGRLPVVVDRCGGYHNQPPVFSH
jgi:hypothetical protein